MPLAFLSASLACALVDLDNAWRARDAERYIVARRQLDALAVELGRHGAREHVQANDVATR